MIQAKFSPIEFDFMAYAVDRWRGYYYHKGRFFDRIKKLEGR